MSIATKWVKQHGFNNSIVISCKCYFKLIHSYKGQSQNPKCVVVQQVNEI
jgi:hypothetical protein